MSDAADPQLSGDSLPRKLATKTHFLSLRLYVVVGVFALCLIAVLLLVYLFVRLNRVSSKSKLRRKSSSIPAESKEIVEVMKLERENEEEEEEEVGGGDGDGDVDVKDVEKGKGNDVSLALVLAVPSPAEARELGWGRWYSLKELDMATCGFADECVIGEGGYGVVYRGVLNDGSVVAIKKLLNTRGQAEKEFKVEVEAIGKVRHKNLVGLIGYCAEDAQRMLVYEYIDNGTLEQWLHGDVGPVSPLTWDIRMKIASGTAKGLAYLHEGLEPKVVHRDVKSSNILLDRKWNAKVSDFGLAKLLKSEASYVTTRVMGTFGYVSPEYASTGMLNEGSDVYSFGVLLMELITGRSPVDYSRPAGEMNLVEWFRARVSQHGEDVLDPLLSVHPPSRALKRALLICLRCVDLDANKRPKMGQIVHMLEGDDFPFRPDLLQNRGRDLLTARAAESYRSSHPLKYGMGCGPERLR